MFRAFLIAIGISMCIVGGEFLVVDQAVMTYPHRSKGAAPMPASGGQDPFSGQSYGASAVDSGGVARHEFNPPEWAPWSLLSGGIVVALYAITVQRD